jgi:hypothetical protein
MKKPPHPNAIDYGTYAYFYAGSRVAREWWWSETDQRWHEVHVVN